MNGEWDKRRMKEGVAARCAPSLASPRRDR